MFTTFASRLALAALAAAVLLPAAAQAKPANPQIFVEKNCTQCHKVSAYGIAGAEAGPDLSIAWTDVKDRYGVSLDAFMKKPTGTMQFVLSSMIKLTPEERDDIVTLLKDAHDKKLKK